MAAGVTVDHLDGHAPGWSSIVWSPHSLIGEPTRSATRNKKSLRTDKNEQTTILPIDQWRYCVRDKYPEYIT